MAVQFWCIQFPIFCCKINWVSSQYWPREKYISGENLYFFVQFFFNSQKNKFKFRVLFFEKKILQPTAVKIP